MSNCRLIPGSSPSGEEIVAERGTHPQLVRCDNESEMASAALRDWCRFSPSAGSPSGPSSPTSD